MKRNLRICYNCKKQILRHHHWHMESVEGLIQWMLHRFVRQYPVHWDCDLPHVPKTTIHAIDRSLEKVLETVSTEEA